MKPRISPAMGEVIIGTITFHHSPFPSHQCCLSGSAQMSTRQLLWAAASAAPHSPPMSAWLELEGRPNHHVSKFQAMAPINAQRMMSDVIATALASTSPEEMV